jgi:serine/threonine-protein kinase
VLADLTEIAATGYVSPVSFAIVHIGLGNTDIVLDYAERAYDERRGWLAYLTVNPLFDGLQGNPRFESLIDRMGLPRRTGSSR